MSTGKILTYAFLQLFFSYQIFIYCLNLSFIYRVQGFNYCLYLQTDLLVAAAQSGKIINIKKGQFCGHSVSYLFDLYKLLFPGIL